jgi:sugar/nucleoside kinase (ribokinase family)
VTRTSSARDVQRRLGTVSFGSVFLEVVFGHTSRLPQPGEEIFIDPFAFSCGGAVTSAVAASRAGANAAMASVLGDDIGSRLAERLCSAEGVDLSPSVRLDGPVAGITVVLNFAGDRAFITHMPPRQPASCTEAERWREILLRERPAWAYVHANPAVVEVLEAARSVGTRVALDVNLEEVEEFPEAVERCARLAQLFLPNEEELRRVTRRADVHEALATAASWCPWVVAKRGDKGAVVAESGRTTEVTDGLKDVEVKDLTGAGDAFAGALMGSLSLGAGLLEAVSIANAAGSEAAARLGASGEMELVPDLVRAAPARLAAEPRRSRRAAVKQA